MATTFMEDVRSSVEIPGGPPDHYVPFRRYAGTAARLWDHRSPAWAARFLDEWCRQTLRSRPEPIKKIAPSLRQHRGLIFSHLRAQKLISSGAVVSLNNEAKVTMRKSQGYRTYRVLELALYHSLAKLPEPASPHDFFRRIRKTGRCGGIVIFYI